MSDTAPRIEDTFLVTHREEDSTVIWTRTSPDVEGAKIKATFVIQGLPRSRRVEYAKQIKSGNISLPDWGGSDY